FRQRTAGTPAVLVDELDAGRFLCAAEGTAIIRLLNGRGGSFRIPSRASGLAKIGHRWSEIANQPPGSGSPCRASVPPDGPCRNLENGMEAGLAQAKRSISRAEYQTKHRRNYSKNNDLWPWLTVACQLGGRIRF